MSKRKMKGLSRQPLRCALDVFCELVAVPMYLDGLVLENARLRRAYSSYVWIVEKSGTGDLPQVPEREELQQELLQMDFLFKGDAFQACCSYLSAENCPVSFRELLTSYFRGRLEEEPRGQVASSQLWRPAEALLWVCGFVVCVKSFGRGKEELKLLSELWKMHKKACNVVLFGRVVWCLGDFLKSYVPDLVREAKLNFEDLKTLSLQQAKHLEATFVQEMQALRVRSATWIASIAKQKLVPPVSEALKNGHQAILQGLTLALKIRRTLKESTTPNPILDASS